MKFQISQFKQGLQSKTGAKSLVAIKNLHSVIQEVLWEMMSNVDLPSSLRKVVLSAPLSTNPNLYQVPEDMNLDAIINIYPENYLTNTSGGNMQRYGVFKEEFIRCMSNNMLSLDTIDGKQYLNIGSFISTQPTENYVVEYYSTSVVYDKDGVIKPYNLIDVDTDYLMLTSEEYILFLRLFSVITGVDIKPASAGTEINVYGKNLASMYQMFMDKHPSKRILFSSNY